MLPILFTKLNKTNADMKTVEVENFDKLKRKINAIKSANFEENVYFINSFPEINEFFKENYNPQFYNIDDRFNTITLYRVPNGVRRTLHVRRPKIDNDKKYKKMLKRLENELFDDFSLGSEFEITSGNRYINVHLKDMHGNEGNVVIDFNTTKWTYRVLSVNYTNAKELMDYVIRKMEKVTAGTRKYRKRNENNAQ